jgi:hypothetical protein
MLLPVLGQFTSRLPRSVPRPALVVGVVAVVATVLKLVIAYRTHGTDDVRFFRAFADGIAKYGWIDAYGQNMAAAQYNHPPLTGLLLAGINAVRDLAPGIPFEFLIRVPACGSDLITALLVFALVRTYRTEGQAVAAGVLVSVSPVLFIVSGFHGNTDPVFVMLTTLSLYLLIVRRIPFLAGVAFAMGLSIKLIPVVVLPLLLLVALRAGWRRLLLFGGGAALFFAATWGPVVLLRWAEFKANVLQYAGFGSQWGVVQILRWFGVPENVLYQQVTVDGRYAALAVSAGVPVLLAWRRPAATVPAFGLAYTLFLLLTPAHAMQYMSWAAAPVVLVSLWGGLAYQLTGGLLLVRVYDRWNHAHPWHWDTAYSYPLDDREKVLAFVAWLALVAAALTTLRYRRSTTTDDRESPGHGARPAPDGPADRPPVQPSDPVPSY